MNSVFIFILAGARGLCAGFFSHNGASNMVSVVLSSGWGGAVADPSVKWVASA